MRRLVAAVAVAAVAALAVPTAPAYACSPPMGYFDADRESVVAGTSVLLTGDVVADAKGRIRPCEPMVPPLPSPSEVSESPEPPDAVTTSPEPDPGPSSIVTLPPLVPVAYAAPTGRVTVALWEARDWDEPHGRDWSLGSIAPNPNRWVAPGLLRWSFRGRVTIPADVPPGEYTLGAHHEGGVGYGVHGITVTRGLAATGTATVALLKVALLALVTGAGALRAARLVRQ